MSMADDAPARLVVLLSGRGSHLENLHRFLNKPNAPRAQIVGVISDKAQAPGLAKAKAWQMPTALVERTAFESTKAFEAALTEAITAHAPDWIILAGFMRILSPQVIAPFAGRMINVHPSLLPKYKGLNTHQKALDGGDTSHGASIHFVTQQLDGGPILSQVSMDITPSDDAESLATRLLPLEHRLMQTTVALLVQHDVKCVDDAIELDGQKLQAPLVLDRDFNDGGLLLG